MNDDRPQLIVHTDHNPDEIRSFYEIPDAIARLVQSTGDQRTFAQCLADLAVAGQMDVADGSDA